MSQTLTPQTNQDLTSQQTSSAFITLFKIYVPSGADYDCYYLCDNSENITSSAMTGSPQLFTAYPIQASFPADEEGKINTARIAITNIERGLVNDIRQVSAPLLVEMVLINSKELDVAMYRTPCMRMRGISYDDFTITGQLSFEDYISEAYPGEVMAPYNYPALFRA